MKFKILIVTLLSLSAAKAVADTELKVRTLNVDDTTSELSLDLTSVRCSNIGYSARELKISVPDLAFISFFNHTNPGEIAPCMTAGRCHPGFEPKDVLAKAGSAATVTIHRELKEELSIDHDTKTCTRTLVEDVSTELAGIPFKHHREGFLGSEKYETCVQASR